jgi:hypothetical protein
MWAHHRLPFSFLAHAERTWREEARFASPAELSMCLCGGLAFVLRVSGGNAVLMAPFCDAYIEWGEAGLGK